MLGAHKGPVAAPTPAFGMMCSVPDSLVTRIIAAATPECTVPSTTSTLSRVTRRLTLSVAFAGSDSSSTLKNSTSRPPSLPPLSASAMRKPFSIATPSGAKVPVYGSIRPTLIFAPWESAIPGNASPAPSAPAPFRKPRRSNILFFMSPSVENGRPILRPGLQRRLHGEPDHERALVLAREAGDGQSHRRLARTVDRDARRARVEEVEEIGVAQH